MQRFPQLPDPVGQRSYSVKGLFERAISRFRDDPPSNVPLNPVDEAKALADRQEKADMFMRIIETLTLVILNLERFGNAGVGQRANARLDRIHTEASELVAAQGNFDMSKYYNLVTRYLRTKTYYEARTTVTAQQLQNYLDEQWSNLEQIIAMKNPLSFRQQVERVIEDIATDPTRSPQEGVERFKKSLSLTSEGIDIDNISFEQFYRNSHPDVPSSVRGSSSFSDSSHGFRSNEYPDVPTSARLSYGTGSSH